MASPSFTHLLVSTEGTGKPVVHYTTATQDLTIANPNSDTGSAADLFGKAVAVSGDRYIIGAPHEDAGAIADTGRAYYYNNSNGAQVTFTNPSDASPDYFGWAVAVDIGTVVIGAPGDDDPATDSGKVYVYNVQNQYTNEINTPIKTFSNPNNHNGTTSQGTFANDQFGYSVAVSGDYVVAGAPYDEWDGTNSGKAYVFNKNLGTLVQTLTAPAAISTNEFFGKAVAVSGSRTVVGAPGRNGDAGRIFVYDTVLGGTPLFDIPNPNFDATKTADNFGNAVAISGKYVIAGAWYEDDSTSLENNAGMVYVFDLTSGTPTTPILRLRNPAASGQRAQNFFGTSVDIEGIHAVVGAPGFNGDDGVAYVYDVTSTAYVGDPADLNINPFYTFNNPTSAASDKFGSAVGIGTDGVIVGAEGANEAYRWTLS